MLNPKRLEEIGYGSVRQSEEEGRDMARTLLTLMGDRAFKSENERVVFETFMAQRFGDSIDQRRCLNGDGNDYMSWDMGIARTVWLHLTSQRKSFSLPVGEIVAWSGTNRDMGITRDIDFRFFRFDVKPGTKLYAVEPAPAVTSDLLTRAEALAVETRALASRIQEGE